MDRAQRCSYKKMAHTLLNAATADLDAGIITSRGRENDERPKLVLTNNKKIVWTQPLFIVACCDEVIG